MGDDAALRLLLIADTHVPRRAKDLPAAVWEQVEAADVVVHAGDWVTPDLLDELEEGIAPPSSARLRDDLRRWLAKLDPDASWDPDTAPRR